MACAWHWSVSTLPALTLVARSERQCGVDLEFERTRPAALRAASRWCGRELTGVAQWTQAEAIWKAGTSVGTPEPHSIQLPPALLDSWALTSDGRYWVFTTRDGMFWQSIALEAVSRSDGS